MSAKPRAQRRSTAITAGTLAALTLLALAAVGCGPVYVQGGDDGYYRGQPTQPAATQPAYTQPARPAQPAYTQPAQPARPVVNQNDPSLYFRDLARFGRWQYLAGYGRVWYPFANRTPGWRPYYLGYWENTAYGWTWVSSESWGWGPYHYGRWFWSNKQLI